MFCHTLLSYFFIVFIYYWFWIWYYFAGWWYSFFSSFFLHVIETQHYGSFTQAAYEITACFLGDSKNNNNNTHKKQKSAQVLITWGNYKWPNMHAHSTDRSLCYERNVIYYFFFFFFRNFMSEGCMFCWLTSFYKCLWRLAMFWSLCVCVCMCVCI